jgi:hypothetical protein
VSIARAEPFCACVPQDTPQNIGVRAEHLEEDLGTERMPARISRPNMFRVTCGP